MVLENVFRVPWPHAGRFAASAWCPDLGTLKHTVVGTGPRAGPTLKMSTNKYAPSRLYGIWAGGLVFLPQRHTHLRPLSDAPIWTLNSSFFLQNHPLAGPKQRCQKLANMPLGALTPLITTHHPAWACANCEGCCWSWGNMTTNMGI